MSNERVNQGQCYRTLSLWGWATKNEDVVICLRCHSKVHPKATGIADYFAAINTPNGAVATMVEMKGGENDFRWKELRDEQIVFLEQWEAKTNGTAWIFLVMGTERVNSTNPTYRRRTWLIPFREFIALRDQARERTGVDYLPLNQEIASAPRKQTKDITVNAISYLAEYELNWFGDETWMPKIEHPFVEKYNLGELHDELNRIKQPELFETS
jgi:hypothetical protein